MAALTPPDLPVVGGSRGAKKTQGRLERAAPPSAQVPPSASAPSPPAPWPRPDLSSAPSRRCPAQSLQASPPTGLSPAPNPRQATPPSPQPQVPPTPPQAAAPPPHAPPPDSPPRELTAAPALRPRSLRRRHRRRHIGSPTHFRARPLPVAEQQAPPWRGGAERKHRPAPPTGRSAQTGTDANVVEGGGEECWRAPRRGRGFS